MITALGLDLDSTLYEHAQFVRGAHTDVAAVAASESGVDRDAFLARVFGDWQRLGSRANTIFRDALRDFGAEIPGLEGQLVQAYRDHQPALRLYPGVREGLAELRRSGVRLGLLSDGQVPVQMRKLAALGLADWFDAVVVTGELGSAFYKPHPAGFELLAKRLGATPAAMAYVGDNPLVDFAAAKHLGMCALRVRTSEYSTVTQGTEWIDHEFDETRQAIAWAGKLCAGNQQP